MAHQSTPLKPVPKRPISVLSFHLCMSLKWSLPSTSLKLCMHVSSLHACYMSNLPHLPCIYHQNNIVWMNLLINYSSPILFLRCKYFPPHFVLQHLIYGLSLVWDWV
jgi:hypothetical protein